MLRKIIAPQYDLIQPSTGKELLFQPMSVEEEKILAIAMEGDDKQQIRALKQVLGNCIITPGIAIDKLPTFDVDYIWLKIRSKSVQETVTIPFKCRNPLEGEEQYIDDEGEERGICGTVVNMIVDLEKIQVKFFPENNPKVIIDPVNNIGFVLSYPTLEIADKLAKMQPDKGSEIETLLDVIVACTVMVFQGEETYEKEHIQDKELKDVLNSLMGDQFAMLVKFFDTLPVMKHEVHFKCPKCRYEDHIVIEGTKSFLASDSTMTLSPV